VSRAATRRNRRPASRAQRATAGVFLNVPFDSQFEPLLRAIVFTVFDCGFRPRCALEISNSGQVRLDKICKLVSSCRLGIHDLSRVELDSQGLPRFNMPFELGLFMGAQRFGPGSQRRKIALILDAERYRFQRCCSDIAGQDGAEHRNQFDLAMRRVRDWLAATPERRRIVLPGGHTLVERYRRFQRQLPIACKRRKLRVRDLGYADLTKMVVAWQRANPL
jgi:hypothetical protein